MASSGMPIDSISNFDHFFTYLCLRWHFSNCSEIGLLLPGHPGAAAIAALGCRRSCNRRSLSSVTAPSRETTVLPRVVVLKGTADGTGVGALKEAILQLDSLDSFVTFGPLLSEMDPVDSFFYLLSVSSKCHSQIQAEEWSCTFEEFRSISKCYESTLSFFLSIALTEQLFNVYFYTQEESVFRHLTVRKSNYVVMGIHIKFPPTHTPDAVRIWHSVDSRFMEPKAIFLCFQYVIDKY